MSKPTDSPNTFHEYPQTGNPCLAILCIDDRSNPLFQSTYVKHNGIKAINDFSLKESTDVWEGFVTSNYDRFWNVYTKLTTNISKIPVRLVRRGDRPFIQLAASVKDEETGATSITLPYLCDRA